MNKLTAIFLLCLSAACLPLGEGPDAQHLIHDRDLGQTFFYRPAGDPATSYLFVTGHARYQPLSTSDGVYQINVSDLYQVNPRDWAAASAGLGQRQPAVSGIPEPTLWSGVASLTQDSLGRLLLSTVDSSNPREQLVRFDPRSGAIEPLQELDGFVLPGFLASPGRTRIFVDTRESQILLDLDKQTKLGNASDPIFIGENFFYREVQFSTPPVGPAESRLIRIRPESDPEIIGVWKGTIPPTISLVQGEVPPRLLVGTSEHYVLLDPDTLATSEVTPEAVNASFYSASPNGHWLLFQVSPLDATRSWLAYDWTTGESRKLDGQLFGDEYSSSPTWRPGRDEVWFQAMTGFVTWNLTDGRASAYQVGLASCQPGGSGLSSPSLSFSPFSRDGSLWFSLGTEGRELGSPLHVGWADDPGQPTVPIDPEGMWVKYCWELEDYRLLVAAWADSDSRTSLYLVDAKTGSLTALAGTANAVAVGKHRVLALTDWEAWRSAGKLTLIDLASGARALIAEDVSYAAVDAPDTADVLGGTDPLASGIDVAFISRYRLDSPYDGLWVTKLP
jgi:hypothetical protein